jgi:hypothetical protein
VDEIVHSSSLKLLDLIDPIIETRGSIDGWSDLHSSTIVPDIWKLDEYLISLFRSKGNVLHQYHLYSPGKCLLTGGYLILDKGNHGLSLGLSAHCHSFVSVKSVTENVALITIDSPEMKGHWEYRINERKRLEVVK